MPSPKLTVRVTVTLGEWDAVTGRFAPLLEETRRISGLTGPAEDLPPGTLHEAAWKAYWLLREKWHAAPPPQP